MYLGLEKPTSLRSWRVILFDPPDKQGWCGGHPSVTDGSLRLRSCDLFRVQGWVESAGQGMHHLDDNPAVEWWRAEMTRALTFLPAASWTPGPAPATGRLGFLESPLQQLPGPSRWCC